MSLTCENALNSTFLKGPYPDTGVVTGSRKTAIIWTKAETSDCFPRGGALPCRQIIHVGFEVLDDSTLVCGG